MEQLCEDETFLQTEYFRMFEFKVSASSHSSSTLWGFSAHKALSCGPFLLHAWVDGLSVSYGQPNLQCRATVATLQR